MKILINAHSKDDLTYSIYCNLFIEKTKYVVEGPGNRGPTECGTTHEATSGMSS